MSKNKNPIISEFDKTLGTFVSSGKDSLSSWPNESWKLKLYYWKSKWIYYLQTKKKRPKKYMRIIDKLIAISVRKSKGCNYFWTKYNNWVSYLDLRIKSKQ